MRETPRNIETRDRWTPQTGTDWTAVYRSLSRWSRTPGWATIEGEVRERFRGFAGLRTIELGAGLGKISLLMTLKGACVTLLDYNAAALREARDAWGEIGLAAEFVEADLLDPPHHIEDRFDVSMSFGTAEHFLGEERQRVFDAHRRVLRPGGLSIIWVPNRWGIYYRIAHGLHIALGRWPAGLPEVPFTRRELIARARQAGFHGFRVVGGDTVGSDFRSFIWENFCAVLRHVPGRRSERAETGTASPPSREDWARLRDDTPPHRPAGYLGDRFSYPLVLFGVR